jgi:hypothetical protein
LNSIFFLSGFNFKIEVYLFTSKLKEIIVNRFNLILLFLINFLMEFYLFMIN